MTDQKQRRRPMPKFLCLQRSLPDKGGNKPPEGGKKPPGEKPSPAEMQEMYAKFSAWQEKFTENLVDMGGKLGTGKLVAGETPTDGPFVEIKELVGGYMIVSAKSLEEAIEIARECPGLVGPSSGVEVIEIHGP